MQKTMALHRKHHQRVKEVADVNKSSPCLGTGLEDNTEILCDLMAEKALIIGEIEAGRASS